MRPELTKEKESDGTGSVSFSLFLGNRSCATVHHVTIECKKEHVLQNRQEI